jgi:hypothetical protein
MRLLDCGRRDRCGFYFRIETSWLLINFYLFPNRIDIINLYNIFKQVEASFW